MLTFSLSAAVTLSGRSRSASKLPRPASRATYYMPSTGRVGPTTNVDLDSEAASCSGSSGRGHVSRASAATFASRRSEVRVRTSGSCDGVSCSLPGRRTIPVSSFRPAARRRRRPRPIRPGEPSRADGRGLRDLVSDPWRRRRLHHLPDGSAPITGNKITLTTALSIARRLPVEDSTGIQRRRGTAVAPWMTYQAREDAEHARCGQQHHRAVLVRHELPRTATTTWHLRHHAEPECPARNGADPALSRRAHPRAVRLDV